MTTGTTPKGYPYPNGDDPITQGDDAIKALATAVDTHLGRSAGGTVNITTPVAETTYSAVVTFPAGRFTAPPQVVVCLGASDPSTGDVSYTGITATSFNAFLKNRYATNKIVAWVAVQA